MMRSIQSSRRNSVQGILNQKPSLGKNCHALQMAPDHREDTKWTNQERKKERSTEHETDAATRKV